MRILRDLAAADPGEVASSREAVVAIGKGEVAGRAANVLLLADYAVLEGTLDVSSAAAGLVWRLGPGALRLILTGKTRYTAGEALAAGLCDATEWTFTDRSALAFDTAARLIAGRGGDRLERAAFARLFAAGEPQEGLAAFLEKRRPGFRVALEETR